MKPTGKKKDEHAMPPSTSNSQLVEEIMEYFNTKIEENRKMFKDIEPYQPRQLDVPLLRKFTPVTTSQLEKDNQRNAIKDMSNRYNFQQRN